MFIIFMVIYKASFIYLVKKILKATESIIWRDYCVTKTVTRSNNHKFVSFDKNRDCEGYCLDQIKHLHNNKC